MKKNVTIQIQGKNYVICTEQDEQELQKIAAQLDLMLGEASRNCLNASPTERLILVGLEQQDEICTLKKQIAVLQDKLDHYDLGEGLGCVADYRTALAHVNNRADELQHENDSLRAQLQQTFDSLSKLTEETSALQTRKDQND